MSTGGRGQTAAGELAPGGGTETRCGDAPGGSAQAGHGVNERRTRAVSERHTSNCRENPKHEMQGMESKHITPSAVNSREGCIQPTIMAQMY